MNSRLSRIFLGLVLAAMPVFSVACGSSYSANQGSNGGGSARWQREHDGERCLHGRLGQHRREDPEHFPYPARRGQSRQCLHGRQSPCQPSIWFNSINSVNSWEHSPCRTGTYTGAILTISANPGDVTLIVAADPETGFAGTPGATIPPSQIQIQGTTGSAGSKTVPVNINFDSPLVVAANQTSSMDVEFDLSHPAFLVGHVPPALGGQTIWAVNFNRGPVRHHPIRDITRLILRHAYGTVTGISSDDNSITITRDFPVEPPTNPETAIATSQSLTILADATQRDALL